MRREYYAEYCAYYRIASMDVYFDEAETKTCMDVFWAESTPFKKLFYQLDTMNILELACGRGRHVQMYVNEAKSVTLVDILQKNIQHNKINIAFLTIN